MKRKILFLSGTRADFGKLKSLLHAIKEFTNFDYHIFVTGMHMLKRYGSTYKEIIHSGFEQVYYYINQVEGEDMDRILANTIQGLSRFLKENPTDLLIVHGDRIEALAAAITGNLNNILVGHIEGGERSGSVDESIRHAITKLSHIHFVANEEAKNRVIQLGEHKNSVFEIGSPDLDTMYTTKLPNIEWVKKYYDIPFDKYTLLIFHPVVTEWQQFSAYADNVVEACLRSKRNFVLIYPNNDKGADAIFAAYDRLKGNSRFKIFPSLRFEYFLVLLRHAEALVGNSSAGIRESPIYGIPSINIGSRQSNRIPKYSQYIFNTDYNTENILALLENLPSIKVKQKHKSYFGEGRSSQIFLEVLNKDEIWQIPLQKTFYDY